MFTKELTSCPSIREMSSPIAKIEVYVNQIRQSELHFARSRRDKETHKAMFNFILSFERFVLSLNTAIDMFNKTALIVQSHFSTGLSCLIFCVYHQLLPLPDVNFPQIRRFFADYISGYSGAKADTISPVFPDEIHLHKSPSSLKGTCVCACVYCLHACC